MKAGNVTNTKLVQIGSRLIGPGNPVYIVAELSANHNQDFDRAVRLIEAAKVAGADAIKLQTYRPDTITIDCGLECFRIAGGTLWDGRTLYDLYREASTPWNWHPKLKQAAHDLGMEMFSSPFDSSAVDFLETIHVPAYKVASCELVDLPLIEKIARTAKPIIMATGMATLEEIGEAVAAAQRAGATQIALLKCSSAYPAPPEEMNLRAIPELASRFEVPAGLSDHTQGIAVPVAAAALGACIIEKHLTLSRSDGGPDAEFSLEPAEFKEMVAAVRTAEKSLGSTHIGPTTSEQSTRCFRRSLFVVQAMRQGDIFTESNVRSIRPANGLHTRHLSEILGKRATRNIERGTPLSWELVADTKGRGSTIAAVTTDEEALTK
jgi:pseudaminic acid synthase